MSCSYRGQHCPPRYSAPPIPLLIIADEGPVVLLWVLLVVVLHALDDAQVPDGLGTQQSRHFGWHLQEGHEEGVAATQEEEVRRHTVCVALTPTHRPRSKARRTGAMTSSVNAAPKHRIDANMAVMLAAAAVWMAFVLLCHEAMVEFMAA